MEAVLRMGHICLLPLAMAGVPGAAAFATPQKELEPQQVGQLGQACAPFITGISLVVTWAIWSAVCLRRNVAHPQKKVSLSDVPRPHAKPKKGSNMKNSLSPKTAFEASCRQRPARSQEAMMKNADGACLLCGALCFADSGTCVACTKRMLCDVLYEGMKSETKAIDGGRGRKLVSALVPPPHPPISLPMNHSMDGIVGASCADGAPTTDRGSSSRPLTGPSAPPPAPGPAPVEGDCQGQHSEEQNRVTEAIANDEKVDRFAALVAAVNASLADKAKAASAKAASFRAATEPLQEKVWIPRGSARVEGQIAPESMVASETEVATEEQQPSAAEAEDPVAEPPEADPPLESSKLPSRGAGKHAQGDCTPCYFFSTDRGCQWGSDCGFCHLGHVKEIKQRPSKARRERTRKLVDSLVIDSNSGQAVEMLTSQSQNMNERNRRYLKQVVEKKLSRFEGDHLDETPQPSQAGSSSSNNPCYIRHGAKPGHPGNQLEKPHLRAGKKIVYQPAGAGNSKTPMHCMWYFSV